MKTRPQLGEVLVYATAPLGAGAMKKSAADIEFDDQRTFCARTQSAVDLQPLTQAEPLPFRSYEILFWCAKLRVSRKEFFEIVEKVGASNSALESFHRARSMAALERRIPVDYQIARRPQV